MSTIDIAADIEIAADPADIAAVMFDPSREAEWVSVVTGVEVIDPALVRGARVRHTARVMDQEVSWTTEVETVHFPHVLALRIADGPVVGTTRFEIQRSGSGSRVRIRAVGDPGAALSLVPVSMVTGPLQSMLASDLARLKSIVEG
jgi:carbon monoxide dehydrogenase subunit G